MTVTAGRETRAVPLLEVWPGVRLRWKRVVLCVMVPCLVFPWGVGSVEGQESDRPPCEPVSREGIAAVASRLGMTETQTAWLETERGAGRLREPDDLLGLPDAGGEILDEVMAGFCWDGGALASAAARWRRGTASGEARIRWETPRVGAALRYRGDVGAPGRARGGVWGGPRGWTVAAGTIRTRQGLGLLVATPGSEPRGRAPLAVGRESWDVALGLETGRALGAALEHRWGSWQATVVRLWDRDEPGAGWMATGLSRRRGGSGLGLSWVQGPAGRGLGVRAEGEGAGGNWTAEVAGAGAGVALAAAWRMDSESWGLRGSATRLGRGYQDPGGWRVSAPWDDAASAVRWEVRWRPASGRLVRAGLRLDRVPERAGLGWPKNRRGLEIELGEHPAPGIRVGLLWRADLEEPEGVVSGTPDQRVVRVDVERSRRGRLVRFRVEERVSGAYRARALTAAWGVPSRFLLRAAWFGGSVDGLEIWWYRRRAGSLYAWDRLLPGTWLGAWGRVEAAGVRVEVSADVVAGGVDVAVAIRAGG